MNATHGIAYLGAALAILGIVVGAAAYENTDAPTWLRAKIIAVGMIGVLLGSYLVGAYG